MYTINIVYTRRSWEMRGRSQTIVSQTLSSYAYGLLIVHLDLDRWSLACTCVAMLYKGMLVNQTLISIIDLSWPNAWLNGYYKVLLIDSSDLPVYIASLLLRYSQMFEIASIYVLALASVFTVVGLFTICTIYIFIMHSKYSHLPSPKRARWALYWAVWVIFTNAWTC